MKKMLLTILRGFCIGSADVVPGVSGGTMAFVLGIYQKLIESITAFDMETIKNLLCFQWKKAFQKIDIAFLFPLFLGIGIAIVSMSHVFQFLFHHYPIYTWIAFFGFVLASAITIFVDIQNKKILHYFLFFLGIAFGYLIIGLTPNTETFGVAYLFLCGLIAICAMILPGISGSSILVLMGAYTTILSFITNPFVQESLIGIGVVGCGAILGLLLFSRVLHFILKKAPSFLFALMAGIMMGSLRKIWPWKEQIQTDIGTISSLVEINTLPPSIDWKIGVYLLIFFFTIGIGFWLSKQNKQHSTQL